MLKIILVFCLYFFGTINIALAQPALLKGKVINLEKQPAGFVNVLLFKNDKVLVQQTVTDSLGLFVITAAMGNYTLLLKQFDQIFFKRPIHLNQNIDLGEITINDAIMLEGVTIKDRKKLVEQLIDRVVYNVENMISTSGADASEVLSKIPGVRVVNDNISLIGKNGVTIMINEKPTLLSGKDLLNFLKSLPGGSLSKIEVMTNPPARYSAEGNSGIINLVMKEARPDYWSASLSSAYTQRVYSQKRWGGSFNYQKNKLSVLTSLEFYDLFEYYLYYYNYYYPKHTWYGYTPAKIFNKGVNGRVGIDYNITKNWSTGIQYLGTRWRGPSEEISRANIFNPEKETLESTIHTESNIKKETYTLALNYYNKFVLDAAGKRTLYFGIDYFSYRNRKDNNFTTNFYTPDGKAVPDRFYSANNLGNQSANNFSMQTDVDFPCQWADLKMGGKISFTTNNSGIALFNTTTGKPIPDPSQTNTFEYKEHTQALYWSGNKVFSKKLEGQIGLRLERTQTTGNSQTLSQPNYNRYGNLFPTIFLSYKPDSLHVFNINYGKRIERPPYSDMNPFRWYESSISYSEGNPFLQPSFSDNLELSYIYRTNFTNKIYFSRLNNGFQWLTIVENNTEGQISTPVNYIKSWGGGISSSYIFDKINWWTSINTFDLSYASAQSEIKITNREQSGFNLNLSASNDFILNKKQTALFNLSYWYNTSGVSGLGKFSSYGQLDVAFKFFLLDKAWQLSLSGNDLLKTSRSTFTSYTNDIKHESGNYLDTRHFRITLLYNFGGKNIDVKKKSFDNAEEQNRF